MKTLVSIISCLITLIICGCTINSLDCITSVELRSPSDFLDSDDNFQLYHKISVHSNTKLDGDIYLIIGRDTTLCFSDIGYKSQWIETEPFHYHMFVRDSGNYSNIQEFYHENTIKYDEFKLLSKSRDVELVITSCESYNVKCFLDEAEVNPVLDSTKLSKVILF